MEPEKKDAGNGADVNGMRDNNKGLKNDESEQATFLVEELIERLRESGLKIPYGVNTPYINTIPPEKQPPFPGNREIERKLKSIHRWNSMAMVVKANKKDSVGGHI